MQKSIISYEQTLHHKSEKNDSIYINRISSWTVWFWSHILYNDSSSKECFGQIILLIFLFLLIFNVRISGEIETFWVIVVMNNDIKVLNNNSTIELDPTVNDPNHRSPILDSEIIWLIPGSQFIQKNMI